MNSAPHPEDAIVDAALALPCGERAAYVDKACGSDTRLRELVQVLLRAHEHALDRILAPQPGGGRNPVAETNPILFGPAQPAEIMEKPGTLIGRYRILEQVGEGGFGVVYVAEQREPVKRRVALKIIKLGMDTRQVVARFEAERQALALMDHPNIARVIDAGATETGRPYFVMELVRGIKITDHCDKNNLTTAERLKLFIQVCRAIQHAHQKGIIHRDIKPSNILVTLQDGEPVPKVIDFGIAKATQQELTEKTIYTALQQFIGTPAYMSPEQAEMSGLDIDTRTDIYSLGVLLYELLTGRTPFDIKEMAAAGLDGLRRLVREKDPVKPSTRLRGLSAAEKTTVARCRQLEAPKLIHLVRGDLDWIVMKCLEKDRARRYESASVVGSEIERFLNNEPVAARPPSNVYRFRKLVRRNKLAFAAAAAILAALLSGLGVSTLMFLREKRERVRAVRAEKVQEQLREESDRNGRLALEQSRRTEEALIKLEFERAQEMFATDHSGQGLAVLARLIRQQPTNRLAVQRLFSALSQKNFALPLSMPMRHDGVVVSARFSPEGSRVVTASEDHTARIWDGYSGESLTPPLRHSGALNDAEFSPDGRQVATASDDHTARIWDAQTGEPATGPLRHEGMVYTVRFSPDGRLVVTACFSGIARIWNVEAGEPVGPPLDHHRVVRWACFSPDGTLVATAGDDETARIWDAKTGSLARPVMKHPTYVLMAEFSPDGRLLVTTDNDSVARVWDVATGGLLGALDHRNQVFRASFSAGGERILTSTFGGSAHIWDARSFHETTEPMRHRMDVRESWFSPEGLRVLTASYDNTARIWNGETGEALSEPLAHADRVTSASFSPDGLRAVTASSDKTAQIWNVACGQQLPVHLHHGSWVAWAELSPDERTAATASVDHTARVWDMLTGQPLSAPLKHPGQVSHVQFHPDGAQIITVSLNAARLWDVRSGSLAVPPLTHAATVRSATFSPDGQRILTGSEDGTAVVWDTRTGQRLLPPLVHDSAVNEARFSPDGTRIVTSAGDAARLWDAEKGEPLAEPLRHQGRVLSACFSPDGRLVLTASADHTARLWDGFSGRPMAGPLLHSAPLTRARFSPDGKWIVTIAADLTSRVWSAGDGRPLTARLKHHSGIVDRGDIDPGSLRAITCSADATTIIWDLFTGQPVADTLRMRSVWTPRSLARELATG